MSYKWKLQSLTPQTKEAAKLLTDEIGINPILGPILMRRGVRTPREAKKFFRPQLTDLLDPFEMKDMDKAVDRLNRAIGMKESAAGVIEAGLLARSSSVTPRSRSSEAK